MPTYHVERSIVINAPITQIKESLQNFQEWSVWSPWLMTEPDAKLEFSANQGEVGSSYSWEGEIVGKGSMTTTAITDNKITMQLTFITPFKSEAVVYFDLTPEVHGTRVVWNMDGKLPFFLFFMVKKMKNWIGMDYERGLAMLKEYIETGRVISRVEMVGMTSLPATSYIGISDVCPLQEIAEVMPAHYHKLYQFLEESSLPTDNIPFAIYDYMDMNTKMIGFTSAIPVPKSTPCSAPFAYGELPETKALQVDHFGKYTHLGNAWGAVMGYARYKKIKTQKKPMGFEFYPNDPDKVAVEELHTQVFLPLKQ